MEQLSESHQHRLVDIVGAEHVLIDDDTTSGYCVDWTGRFAGRTPAVVRPGSTEEVAEVLRVCSQLGIAVVPQGGNTGLVGGGVPLSGEIVISLRRLDEIEEIDTLSNQVTCGAGVTLVRLQDAAAAEALSFGVDLAARDSCTIGGMVATNAGGIHVLRYGAMRAQVVGIESVLSDGRVLSHIGGLTKDNTGYDLDGLMCGSEGTLGIITKVRVRLHQALSHRTTAMVGLASVTDAVDLLAHLRRCTPSLLAVEAIFGSAMDVVTECQDLVPPVSGDMWLLVDVASQTEDPTDELASALGSWTKELEVAVATDRGASERLWRFRESITESISQLGVPHKLDVTLPAVSLAAFAAAVEPAIKAASPEARVVLFGHLGDGNLHVNVLGVDDHAPDETVDGVILELVASYGGSISAEHGIGTAKAPWLHLSRSASERAVFTSIRAALDPSGIMNPNVLVTA